MSSYFPFLQLLCSPKQLKAGIVDNELTDLLLSMEKTEVRMQSS